MTRLHLHAAADDAAPRGQEDRPVSKFSWERALGYLVAGLLAYGAIQSRIAVLEVEYEQIARDVAEIKGDVKTLIRAGGSGGGR